MSVDEWLMPMDGGRSAHTELTVRKFGLTVARGEAVIRKLG
jgi:hypothetical protein